jgi:4-aminobutyrate aminotransferase-like enzyme
MPGEQSIEQQAASVKSQADCVASGDLVYRHGTVPRFVAAYGCELVDDAGYRYLDAEASSGTAGLGFDSLIVQRAAERVAAMPVLPSFCESALREEVAARLAARLNEATGRAGRIAFELGGAQGIELALKVVRRNRAGSQIAVFEGGYHGRSGLAAQLSASHRLRRLDGDWRIPLVRLPYPDPERGPFRAVPGGFAAGALARIEQLATADYCGMVTPGADADVAALIIEPALNAGGIVLPDLDYVLGVVETFRSLGALIVVDEIFCGFHRLGPAWGFQRYPGLDPDIVVVGKALTNGIVPMTCVWAREPLMDRDHFPPGTHASTFQTTPLALAIASEVLDRYDAWADLPDQISSVERGLRAIVDDVVDRSATAISGWASGCLARIRLDSARAPWLAEHGLLVGRDEPAGGVNGLVLSAPGMAPDVIGFAPPLVIGETELEILHELTLRLFARLPG